MFFLKEFRTTDEESNDNCKLVSEDNFRGFEIKAFFNDDRQIEILIRSTWPIGEENQMNTIKER